MHGDFSIGEWRVQPQINQIQKNKISFHLEPKVMQVLVLLASKPGELVSKERLLQTVWSGVFVGEDVLTRAISEIRRVLADDARSPRVIQTIPKTGYRLIAPVSFDLEPKETMEAEPSPPASIFAGDTAPASLTSLTQPPTEPAQAFSTSVPESKNTVFAASDTHRSRLAVSSIMAICAFVGGFSLWHFWPKSTVRGAAATYRALPFTTYPGSEGQPAFSPDGNQIAFVWNGKTGTNKAIYVKILGTANPLRLTTDAGDNVNPAWSPDGRFIAFIRRSSAQNAIYIVPAIGGPERRIHTLSDPASSEYAGLTWSIDGKQLIFPDRPSAQDSSSLFSVSLDTLETKRLTTPPSSWDGDWTPVISPDGRRIAFVRGPESAVRDVYVMDVSGGEPRRLTTDGRLILGLAWMPDSRNIVFSSNRSGSFSLWQMPISGGVPVRLAAGGENAYSPAISLKGNLLAYTHGTGKWDIVRLDLRASAPVPGATRLQILSSNEQDSAPQYSPDGTRIVFQSWRSGGQELWICSADGSEPIQLTSFGGALTGSPRWSPDGRQIAFDSRADGRAHIYVTTPDGGTPQMLTNGQYNDVAPGWSPDGKWIYFGSNRSGSWQIWRLPSSGGAPDQVTSQGGVIAVPSPDGRWIYYAKVAMSGLWRIPASGGTEQRVLKHPPNGFQGYWALGREGIYYLNTDDAPGSIDFANFSSLEHATRIHALDHEQTPFSGLSVSPDGRWLIYASMVEASSNITLVEDFR